MATLSTEALKQEVKAVFGQTLSDERIEAGKGRIPTMLDNVQLLGAWAGKLGTIGPAQVQKPVEVLSDD